MRAMVVVNRVVRAGHRQQKQHNTPCRHNTYKLSTKQKQKNSRRHNAYVTPRAAVMVIIEPGGV